MLEAKQKELQFAVEERHETPQRTLNKVSITN